MEENELTTIQVTKKFRSKLMNMKYDLGYNSVEEMLIKIIELSKRLVKASELKKESDNLKK